MAPTAAAAAAAFGQELGSKTLGGFVPNGANGAKKARDRTEPIVGAKVRSDHNCHINIYFPWLDTSAPP